MSEIRLKSTGTIKLFENDNTSNVTIASPASLGADRTITLPDGDVTLVAGTMSTSGGITAASQWRVTTNFVGSTGGHQDVTSNWEVVDTDGYGGIGSAMTESSGIFTFPSTGIWYMRYQFTAFTDSQGASNYTGTIIRTTTNDSSYDLASATWQSIPATNESYCMCATDFMFDVTSTSTHKCKFSYETQTAQTFECATDGSRFGVTFIRLGDT